jgi:hypothetical protein
VLNAKGGEIKAKANGSANHLRILKIVELEFVICPKYSYCKKFGLLWGRILIMKKGDFLALGENFGYEKGGVFGT